MPTRGDTSGFEDFFPEGLIPKILKLVLLCWEDITGIVESEREERITGRLQSCINRRNAEQDYLPFRVNVEHSLTDPQTGAETGRIDLLFSHGYRVDVYFAFECKRLRIPYQSRVAANADQYVGEEGMMCFISGQYANGLTKGGMLGYVMDGNVCQAVKSVRKAIDRERGKLKLTSGSSLEISSLLPQNPNVKMTSHHLPGRLLTLHHMFLAVK